MFRFGSWYWLLLLALLPALYWVRRKALRPDLAVASTRGLAGIRSSFFAQTRWAVTALKVLALILMTAALARPQWGNREVTRLAEGINIVLAVDGSESMAAIDFELEGKPVHRLDAVKAVVRDFIARRDGDRIGLVFFGSEAYTQMPLTTDYDTVVSALDRLGIGAAGPSTAIGDALGIAVKRLRDVESETNITILLTDGRSNSGELSPEAAAEVAGKLGVKVYTIGVGTRGEAPFLVDDPLWGQRVVRRRVDIDEEALRQIAAKTGGEYFHADGLEDLKGVYETIDRLEKTEVEMKTFEEYDELYGFFLVPAFAFLVLAAVAGNTRYLEAP